MTALRERFAVMAYVNTCIERAIAIELRDESYDLLIVEVTDPVAAMSKIESAVPKREPTGGS